MSEFYTYCRRYGGNILLKTYDEKSSKPKFQKVKYQPIIFLDAKKDSDSEWTSINGAKVEPFCAGDMYETDKFLKTYEGVANFNIYGNDRYAHTYITEHYPEEIQFDQSKIRIAYLDIEVASANGFPEPAKATEIIVAITLKIGKTSYVLGYQNDYTPSDPNVVYFRFDQEENLIKSFISIMESKRPDIISGWYINGFDIPYIMRRCENLGLADDIKRLSPWGVIKSKADRDTGDMTYQILGVSILDYMELYQKFNLKKKESYTLNYICSDEIGEKKLDYSEQGSIHLLYLNDFQKFIDYNIRDVALVEKLNDKKKFLDLAIVLAYMTKVNFEDVFHQTKMWDALIYDYLYRRNQCYNIFYYPKKKDEQFEGAIVKKPLKGRHQIVVSLDATSLYPSLMMMLNVGPDTICKGHYPFDIQEFVKTRKNPHLDMLLQNDWIMAANGIAFRGDIKGFFPTIVEYVFNKRQVYKTKMLEYEKLYSETKDVKYKILEANMNTMQASVKVCANSAYGVSGAPSFRFYDIRIAEAVTLTGQLCITIAANELNIYLNALKGNKKPKDYVIMADTDSVYLNLEDFCPSHITGDKDIADFFGAFTKEHIDPVLKKAFDDLKTQINAKMQRLNFKREAIAKAGIWNDKKKRYALAAIETEGGIRHDPYLLIIKGFEVVRSTTPGINKPIMKEAIRTMILKDEKSLQELISKFKAEFMAAPYQDIAANSGINNLTEYEDSSSIYGPKCPMQVRGALLYNHHIKKLGIDKLYPPIHEGEKAKYVYLKMPNTIGENVITFQHQIPKEMKLEKYVDRATQFEKTFLNPIQRIADVMGWHAEYNHSLLSLMEEDD